MGNILWLSHRIGRDEHNRGIQLLVLTRGMGNWTTLISSMTSALSCFASGLVGYT